MDFKIQKNVPLAQHTTFKIGGKAKYFLRAKKEKEIFEGIFWAKQKGIPFFILGKGSNLLVSDKGFEGLVIKIETSKIEILNFSKKIVLKIEAGVFLPKLVSLCEKKGWQGLEWMVGIPGSFGGAIFSNAGAFGKDISQILKEVEIFDLKEQKKKIFLKKDCHFSYRGSIFKKEKGRFLILAGKIVLKKTKKEKVKEKTKNYFSQKQKRQPLNKPCAGCIFKNFEGKIEDKNLQKEFPQILEFNKKRMIPAGFLIEKANLLGKKIGKAQISPKHANFIVNLGGAKSKEVKKLIQLCKEKVKEKFKIKLEEEIQYLGFF